MMPAVAILVQRDFEGIRAAYRELLEEDLAARSAQATGAKQPEAKRALADGYYRWVMTLLRIEERREVNSEMSLPADCTDGLVALARVRTEFEHAHPPCPRCSASLLTAHDTFCWSCQHSWKEN